MIFISHKNLILAIEERTWKLCETSRQAPSNLLREYFLLRKTKIEAREGARSFVAEDTFYIYGGYSTRSKVKINFSELWALNLGKVHLIDGQSHCFRNNAVEKYRAEKSQTWSKLSIY